MELLERYHNRLVDTLAKLDLLILARDLQRYRVITSEMAKVVTSLDHKRLDQRTIARYVLHLVTVRVKIENRNLSKFLNVLSGMDNETVATIGRALIQLLPPRVHGVTQVSTENKLVEQDIGYLMEILSGVSYKWEEISIALKLPIACIEECRNAKNNKLRLHSCVSEWISGNHKRARPPMLSELRKTLASETVQLWRLAGEIEEKMKEIIHSTISSIAELKSQFSESFHILYESVDTEIADGKSALLEVQVSPSESVLYQWMKDGQPLSENSSFSGTRNAMLLIKKVSQGKEGEYCCVMSHGDEQLTSSPFAVTIKYSKSKKFLLDKYSHLNEVPQDSWPLVNAETFVDLSLIRAIQVQNDDSNYFVEGEIEDILEKRERVEYENAFGQFEQGGLILVEGRPGSGKTTLAHRITKDWAIGKVLQNVRMVFLVSLRKDKKKSEFFSTFFQKRTKSLQKRTEKLSGDGLCFILDGYDEYSPEHGDKSAIDQLIRRDYLPLAMIIITSRPAATVMLRPRAVRRIEVLGFTRKQFDVFVDKYPFEKLMVSKEAASAKSKLMTYLKACTNVLNMCYLPINACIICFLYSQNLGETLPKTETEIYESLVIAIILRKLRAENPSAQLHSLKDLKGSEKKCFQSLCSIAFGMTAQKKQIVHKLPMSLDSLTKSPFRGLFAVDSIAKLYGVENVLTFLHLTLQEYLAAYYLACIDEELQMVSISLYCGKDHMKTTFKFYCGLVDMLENCHQFSMITMAELDHLYLFHCLYETQEKTLCHEIVEVMEGIVILNIGVLTPADFTVLGYVISTASFLITLVAILPCLLYEEFLDDKWKNRELDDTDPLQYNFETTFMGASVNSKLIIEDLICTHISYKFKAKYKQARFKLFELVENTKSIVENSLVGGGSVGMMALMDFPSDIFGSDSSLAMTDALKMCRNIQHLELYGKYNSLRTANTIASVLKNCSGLKIVTMRSIVPSASACVIAAGFQNCKHLHTIELIHLELCTDGSAALAKGLANCNTLKELHLCSCSISPEGAEAIAIGLKTTFLYALDLSFNNIGCKGALALSEQSHFWKLNLTGNGVGLIGTKALARSLMKSPFLTAIYLGDNNIDSSSAIVLSEGLSYCTGLQDLILSMNDMGPDGAAALAHCLQSCTALQFVRLRSCKISSQGIMALSENFIHWRQLRLLQLSDNGIISDGVAAIMAGGLGYLTVLEELYLSSSGIDSESAVFLAEGLCQCPLIHTLDVSENTIGSAGAIAIAKSLKCKQMKQVNLSHNKVNIESIASLASLVQSSHLMRLDLSYNKIGSTGALCLVTELIHHLHSAKVNLQANRISPKASKFMTSMLCGKKNKQLRILFSV